MKNPAKFKWHWHSMIYCYQFMFYGNRTSFLIQEAHQHRIKVRSMSSYWQTIETWYSLLCMPSNCFWINQPLYKSFQCFHHLILLLVHFEEHHREILISLFFARGYLSMVIIWVLFYSIFQLKTYHRCDIYLGHRTNSNASLFAVR